MKKLLILLLLAPLAVFPQYEKMLDALEDAETEMQDGKLVIRLINAENGEAVPEAAVAIEKLGDYTSDLQGRVLIDIPDDGTYAFSFSKPGFIPANYTFEVIAGTIFYNRFSVSPVIDFGSLRIVLEWSRKPADLDLHLIKQGSYHISYQDMHKANDGAARLDRDDRDGFGPETITVSNVDETATYTCYVKNYSDRNSPRNNNLSQSKATLRVYGDNALLHTFRLTEKKNGTAWMVFEIVGGKVKAIDEVGNQY